MKIINSHISGDGFPPQMFGLGSNPRIETSVFVSTAVAAVSTSYRCCLTMDDNLEFHVDILPPTDEGNFPIARRCNDSRTPANKIVLIMKSNKVYGWEGRMYLDTIYVLKDICDEWRSVVYAYL